MRLSAYLANGGFFMFSRRKCVYFYLLVNVVLAIGFVLYGMTLSLLDWSSVIALLHYKRSRLFS